TAFGDQTTASGYGSTAFGSVTTASNFFSTAFGDQTTASGYGSTAFGSVTTASNFFSTAFGDQTTASGYGSTAFGSSTISSSEYSTAFGRGTAALGSVSTTFGRSNTATSYGEIVIGIGATIYTPSVNGATQFRTANATDRLFVMGNAIDTNNNNIVDDSERSDAMVVLKNGNTGIGSSTPQDRLHVVGNIRMVDGNQAAGSIMVSNANGTASWQTLDVPALNGWSTLGNTGLNAATNFIGTTNAVDVIFRRNNIRAGRLGVNNTSFGVNALNPAGTGIFNTAVGSASLESITNGSRNAAVGSVSLNANTTGDNNTALGVDALSFNETGNNNTAVGRRAMGSTGALTSGSNNTALGYFAYSTGNFTNSTALGANTVITASNQIRVGNNTVTSIGGIVGFTNLSDRRFKKNIQYNAPGLAFIKKLKPATYQLDMESMARFLGTPEESRDRNAERIRENTPETGFIAQEVEQAAREVGFVFSGVDVPQSISDYYGLRYASFVVPLVKAVQEQQQIIETQKEEITQLQEQYRLLLQRVERLEQQ
ncbi:tail fiber domain-containing protein, partial [Paucihalobacter sp.]|uniref:tail fiber domain-containing protein n=1 Tax=Paucihalobacter sp. TaxID=2850405 RepID=UPI002FDF6A67